jgi:hypothetical protein
MLIVVIVNGTFQCQTAAIPRMSSGGFVRWEGIVFAVKGILGNQTGKWEGRRGRGRENACILLSLFVAGSISIVLIARPNSKKI